MSGQVVCGDYIEIAKVQIGIETAWGQRGVSDREAMLGEAMCTWGYKLLDFRTSMKKIVCTTCVCVFENYIYYRSTGGGIRLSDTIITDST